MHIMSPSDIVGPSPVTSNGTEITEIEDDATDEIQENQTEEVNERRRQSEVRIAYLSLPSSHDCSKFINCADMACAT